MGNVTATIASVFSIFGNLTLVVVILAWAVVEIIGMWRVFEKAGKPGWGAIIPFYNVYLLCKIAGRPGWWWALGLIPLVGGIIWFVLSAIVSLDIARNFGKGAGFGVGLWLLGFIFYPILGFGDATYVGGRPASPYGPTPYPLNPQQYGQPPYAPQQYDQPPYPPQQYDQPQNSAQQYPPQQYPTPQQYGQSPPPPPPPSGAAWIAPSTPPPWATRLDPVEAPPAPPAAAEPPAAPSVAPAPAPPAQAQAPAAETPPAAQMPPPAGSTTPASTPAPAAPGARAAPPGEGQAPRAARPAGGRARGEAIRAACGNDRGSRPDTTGRSPTSRTVHDSGAGRFASARPTGCAPGAASAGAGVRTAGSQDRTRLRTVGAPAAGRTTRFADLTTAHGT